MGLLSVFSLSAMADPYGPYASRYTQQAAEPACCYSGQRLWKQTNTQSGWSINTRQFDPYGFPLRDRYRQTQPAPLPRGVQTENPWSVSPYASLSSYQRSVPPGGEGRNAQYFQPAYYNYPPPVAVGNDLDYVPSDFSAMGDPYLTGLAYPYGSPYGPGLAYGPAFLPGMAPGVFPAVPGFGYSPFWPGGGW